MPEGTICRLSCSIYSYQTGQRKKKTGQIRAGTWSGMESEVRGKFKREGAYVYPWLIHVDVRQKATLYCKAIILQLQINKFKFKERIRKKKEWAVALPSQFFYFIHFGLIIENTRLSFLYNTQARSASLFCG